MSNFDNELVTKKQVKDKLHRILRDPDWRRWLEKESISDGVTRYWSKPRMPL